MQHWPELGRSTDEILIECVGFDERQKPVRLYARPMVDYLRSLAVTLPVTKTIKADLPGAI